MPPLVMAIMFGFFSLERTEMAVDITCGIDDELFYER